MAIPLTLRVHRDGQLVATKEFHRDIIKIGRLSSAHLCIEDERVSRIHAVIEVAADGTVSVIDMGSVEGTFVNGKRISKAALANGDVMTMGATRIEVAIGPQQTTSVQAPQQPGAPAAAPAAIPAAPGLAAVPPEVLAAAQQAAAQVIAAAQAAAASANVSAGNAPAANEAAAAVAASPVAEAPAATPAPAPVIAAAAAAQPAPAGDVAAVPPQADGPAPAPGTVAAAWADPKVAEGRISIPLQRWSRTRSTGGSLPLPQPLDRAAAAGPLQIGVRIVWGNQPLTVAHFDQEEKVRVGSAPEAEVQVEAARLPTDPFELLRRVDGSWVLRFGGEMQGEWISESGRMRLADAIRAGRARPSDEAGVYELPLAGHEVAWLDLGNVRADVSFRPKPRPAVVPLAQRLDYQYLNIFAVAAFLVFGCIVGFHNVAWDSDVVQDDLHATHARWARTLFQSPRPQRNPFLEKLALKTPGDPGEAAAKAAGEEGKMGKPDAPQRNTRSAPRGDPNEKDQIKNQGILAMLGKGQNAGLSTIFGSGGLGGDLKGAIGGLTGNVVGDAHGFGGLGLKGTGTGGGGVGNTIGVGDVGTKGRGGGQGSFGTGVGKLGAKGSADVQISTSEAVIVGYDKELVRRVVHAHHSQLRYCYESELVRNPNMTGKVTVKWVIGAQGKVTQANIVGTTLGNARVESCVLSRVKSWNFPPPKGGGIAVVTYPFVFRPSGG